MGEALYKRWHFWATHSRHQPVKKIAAMIRRHLPGVLSYFTHRITSGLSFFSVVALLWWTFARTVRGHLARVAAIAAVAFTVIEAALGAFLVKLGLTAQSRSPLRAPYLALHLTNTLLLLAALTLAAHLLSRRTGYLRGTIRMKAPFGAIASILVVLVVGVTGSIATLEICPPVGSPEPVRAQFTPPSVLFTTARPLTA